MPSDPSRLSSTQASFRIRLSAPVAPMIDAPAGAAFGDPYGLRSGVTPQVVVPAASVPALAGITAASVTGAAPRRRARVVTAWSGQAGPGDTAATQLLEAVRLTTVPAPAKGRPDDDTQQLQGVPRQYGPTGAPGRPRTSASPNCWTSRSGSGPAAAGGPRANCPRCRRSARAPSTPGTPAAGSTSAWCCCRCGCCSARCRCTPGSASCATRCTSTAASAAR
ncbi:hypothetical protein ACFQ2M_19645 [Kitasatospora saccharophila]|uniref:hypothetical protein n=1 Tax=Kitasatospora saccharophila TaxID=407973 RepID=UPI003625A29B